MWYMTLFETSDILRSSSGLHITHDMYINGIFMLLFNLTITRGASVSHTSHPENSNIIIDLKFNKTLPEAITCLLYLQFDNSFRLDFARTIRPHSKTLNRHCASTVYTAKDQLIPRLFHFRFPITINRAKFCHRHQTCRPPPPQGEVHNG